MTQQKKIIYEPHPVAPNRKAELIGKGYQIVDAKFNPNQPEAPGAEESAPKTIEELRTALTAAGVDFAPNAKKADLRALHDASVSDGN